MKFICTDHAKYRKRKRHITDSMIQKALTRPDRTGTGYLGRSLAFKSFPEGEIKVVYTIEHGIAVIISVIWETGGPYGDKL